MSNYDNWKTSPPEPKQLPHFCAWCDEQFEAGQNILLTDDGDLLHEEQCWDAYARDQLGARALNDDDLVPGEDD